MPRVPPAPRAAQAADSRSRRPSAAPPRTAGPRTRPARPAPAAAHAGAEDGADPAPETAPPHDRAAVAYLGLRQRIVRGALSPGAPLVEADVAAQLGISRTPVRAALQRLHQDGLVQDVAGARAFRFVVAPLTREDVEHVFGVIAALEAGAAYAAAALPSDTRASLATALRTANAALQEAADARDAERARRRDDMFHRHYIDACGNPRLAALHAAVKPQAERYERIYRSLLTDVFAVSLAEHEAIAAAIEAGDRDAAQAAVQVNWRNAAARLGHVISTAGERGRW